MQRPGGQYAVLHAGRHPLRRAHGHGSRRGRKRNLDAVVGRRRRTQFQRVPAGVHQRPQHALGVAEHGCRLAVHRHLARPPSGVARQRHGHLRQRMHGKPDGQRVRVHAHVGGGDFGAVRRARMRAQQSPFEFVQQLRRRRRRRGRCGQRQEHGGREHGGGSTPLRQAQPPMASGDLESETRREHAQRDHRQEAQQGGGPRRQDDQAHVAFGVHRPAPRQRIGCPLPRRDARAGLPRLVHAGWPRAQRRKLICGGESVCRHDLVTIAFALDLPRAIGGGRLPCCVRVEAHFVDRLEDDVAEVARHSPG